MGLLNPHLDDAAFAELWADRLALGPDQPAGSEDAHLRGCAECRARFAAFGSWLETIQTDATAEADEIFTHERLTAQQAHIGRRLEALEHPGRVIAFPRFTGPVSSGRDTSRRWVAAAAAAGLVAGLGLGQLLELRTPSGYQAGQNQPQIARAATPPVVPAGRMGGIQPVSAQVSDESFLYDQDGVGLPARVPESLQYLNAITPSARDYDPR